MHWWILWRLDRINSATPNKGNVLSRSSPLSVLTAPTAGGEPKVSYFQDGLFIFQGILLVLKKFMHPCWAVCFCLAITYCSSQNPTFRILQIRGRSSVDDCVCEIWTDISNFWKFFYLLHSGGYTGLQVSAAQQTSRQGEWCQPLHTGISLCGHFRRSFSINLWGRVLYLLYKGGGGEPLHFSPQKNLLPSLFYHLLEFLVFLYWGC